MDERVRRAVAVVRQANLEPEFLCALAASDERLDDLFIGYSLDRAAWWHDELHPSEATERFKRMYPKMNVRFAVPIAGSNWWMPEPRMNWISQSPGTSTAVFEWPPLELLRTETFEHLFIIGPDARFICRTQFPSKIPAAAGDLLNLIYHCAVHHGS